MRIYSLHIIKHTSDFLSVFSCVGLLKMIWLVFYLFEKAKSHRGVESVVLIFGNKNGEGGGILICCASDCKYADGWRRLDNWGPINR
jgi:hypothetical protein